MHTPPSRVGAPRRGREAIWLVAALALAAAVHAPSLGLGFVGDDFEWWLAARTAIERPHLLVAPYGGFRPANLWTMVLDQLAWGTVPAGYHLTSLLLHLGCGALLWLVLRRLSLGPRWSALVAALWLCSPYSLKPVLSVCERFQPLLLASWLGLVLLWPRRDEPWRRGRVAAVVAVATFTVLVKESWVVLPALVLVFERLLRRAAWWAAVRTAAVAAVGVAAYVAVYALNPPIASSYYAASPAPAAKVPHAAAVFLGLTELDPSSTQLGWAEAAAALALAALLAAGWRRRRALAGVGLALFLLPFVPILTVPFLVTRYTYIPLVGFLMLAAGAAASLVEVLPADRRRAASAVIALVAVAFLGRGLLVIRGDYDDAARRDDVHRRLLAEAAAFAPQLPRQGLILGVRLESISPNRELLADVRGVGKAYYERSRYPYGLIRWAPLFSYVLDATGGPLYEECPVAVVEPFAVVAHRPGAVSAPAAEAATAPLEAERWRGRGAPVAAFRPLTDGGSARVGG